MHHYNVFRGDSAAVGSQAKVAETTELRYVYTGLACGTSYSLALQAQDAAGNTSNLAEAVWYPVTTLACDQPPPPPADTEPPSTPSNLRVASSTTTSIELAWGASTDNVGVTGYNVYLNGIKVWTTIGTTHTNLGLSCGTTYTLAVDAYDAASNVSGKAELSTATMPCAPPASTISQTISGESPLSGDVRWEATVSGAAPASVHFLVDGTERSKENLAPYCFNGDATCAIDTTTIPNGSHAFRVESRDSSGAVIATDTETALVDNTALPPPPSPPPPPPPAPPPPPPPSGTVVQPGQSWNSAYQQASCGQVLSLAAGTHPSQTIVEKAALNSCSQPVTFQPVDGAQVTVSTHIYLGSCQTGCYSADAPSNLVFRGFAYTGSFDAWGDARNILIDNVNGGGFVIQGVDGFTVRNSDLGPCNSSPPGSCARVMILDDNNDPTDTRNVLFENNTIHDFVINASGDHWECMFTTGGTNVTIRRNKFWNCHTYAIATGQRSYSLYTNWTIENNWFGRTCCFGTSSRSSAIHLGNAPNILIRFNSFAPGQTVVNESGSAAANVRIVGNLLGSRSAGCVPGASYVQNLQLGGGCGATDGSLSSMPYVNTSDLGAMDFHLVAGSVAEAFVTSSSPDASLNTDWDGQARSTPRDAGSDEH